MQSVVFIEDGNWLQKRSFLQRNYSSLLDSGSQLSGERCTRVVREDSRQTL
jgi:hypothetical protein